MHCAARQVFLVSILILNIFVSTYNWQLGPSFWSRIWVHLLKHRQGFAFNQIQRTARFTCDSDISHVGAKSFVRLLVLNFVFFIFIHIFVLFGTHLSSYQLSLYISNVQLFFYSTLAITGRWIYQEDSQNTTDEYLARLTGCYSNAV